jgi:hypothetical protein
LNGGSSHSSANTRLRPETLCGAPHRVDTIPEIVGQYPSLARFPEGVSYALYTVDYLTDCMRVGRNHVSAATDDVERLFDIPGGNCTHAAEILSQDHIRPKVANQGSVQRIDRCRILQLLPHELVDTPGRTRVIDGRAVDEITGFRNASSG